MKIKSLKVCGAVAPVALTEKNFRFSFVIDGSAEEKERLKIAVASSLDKIENGDYDVWQSEAFLSNEQNVVFAPSEVFHSDKEYFWRVVGEQTVSDVATFGVGLKKEEWTARWVAREAASEVAPIFLSRFSLQKQVKRAKLYVCGLGYFEAYINGEVVGNDGFVPQVSDYGDRPLNGCFETTPVGTRKSVYYLAYDISKALKADNDIAVLVGNGWFKNREKPNEGNFYYGEPKCIFEMRISYVDGTEEIFASNGGNVKIGDSNLLRNTLYTGEIVDFTKALRLRTCEYEENELQPCKEVRDEEGEFLYQKEPSDTVSERIEVKEKTQKDGKTLFDFGQNHSGVLTVRVKGKKGTRVEFTYGENKTVDGDIDVYSSSWGGHIQKDLLILGGAEDFYRSKFTVHGYRYAEMQTDGEVEILQIYSEFVHSAVAVDGDFQCSEPLFEQILKNYRYTHCSNLHGNVPTDCPHRERRGFLGDGHAAMGAAMYAFDMYLSYGKWMKDIRDTQSLTGYMPHTAPFSGGGGGPGFGSGCIIIPYLYYRFYGDKSGLEEGYTGMLNWIKYLNTRHDGDYIIVREEAGWCIGEWFNPTLINLDIPFANTYFFILSLDKVIEITKILGRERELPWLTALRGKVCEAFMRKYYNAEKHSFCGDGKGAAFFGVDLGLLNEDDSRICVDRAVEHIKNDLNYHLETGIFGTPLMFKILSKYGRKDVLCKILSKTDYPGYGYMIARGATTLWEGFEERDGPSYLLRDGLPQTGYGVSHNHPMLGSVCQWMFAELAGLNVSDLGATREIQFTPYTGGTLTYASAYKETVYGTAKIDWKKSDGKTTAEVVVPYGCQGKFIVETCYSTVTVDGEEKAEKQLVLSCGRHVVCMQ